MDFKQILTDLFDEIEQFKMMKVTAGTRFRLMGLVADIVEVTQAAEQDVLGVVSHEAVLDADADVDYAEWSELVLTKELPECAQQDAKVSEQTGLVNESLGALSDVLTQIDGQLSRHHKDEEYERLYEAEKRRYMSSGTAHRARQAYEEWKELNSNGNPTVDDLLDYRICKLLRMFEKGVFNKRVDQIQRAKRYPGEVDFEQLDDDKPMKRIAHRHYAALRKLVDFRDGFLMADPVRVGRHFYASRHEESAKSNRTNFLKYMHKIELAQEELRRVLAMQEVAAVSTDEVTPTADVAEDAETGNDLIAQLKPIFFNNEADVRMFLKEIIGMPPNDITDLVNRWVQDKRISNYGNSRKGTLWSVLNDTGLYTKSRQNWNRRVY